MIPAGSSPPLASYASEASKSRGRLHTVRDDPTRSAFQRDRDRIIHSGAFRRLRNKTQVFVESEGDYYRTRLTHSLEVAQIARSLARQLRIDEDLTEAIALAHDLGHTCYGHAGEDALAECMQPYGGFSHNDQTFRILTQLELRYFHCAGLNLSWETLEGVAKHNGPLLPEKPDKPVPPTIREFSAAWDLELAGWPSLEAQIAALADDIAYNTHDIDDGYRAGFFRIDEVRELPLFGDHLLRLEEEQSGAPPQLLMHAVVRKVINDLVQDLLRVTAAQLKTRGIQSVDEVRAAGLAIAGFSPDVQKAEIRLRAFLMEKLYRAERVNRMTSKARRVVRDLFHFFMKEPNCLPAPWFAEARREGILQKPERLARLIADYVAGMTDRYALLEYRRLFSVDVVI